MKHPSPFPMRLTLLKGCTMHFWAILAFLVAGGTGVAAALLRQWLVVLLALAVCLGLVPAVFELTS